MCGAMLTPENPLGCSVARHHIISPLYSGRNQPNFLHQGLTLVLKLCASYNSSTTCLTCLVGGYEHFSCFYIWGISSSQVTNSYFSDGFNPKLCSCSCFFVSFSLAYIRQPILYYAILYFTVLYFIMLYYTSSTAQGDGGSLRIGNL